MAESEELEKESNGEIEVELARSGKGLGGVIRDLLFGIASDGQIPLSRRIRVSISTNAPRLKDASRRSAQALLTWTREGSTIRVLLVISVGTITLLALAGLLTFMVFFLAATLNAIVISLLMSLAAAGGCLALFFAFTTLIYVGALFVAAFVISTAVTFSIIGIIIATGWLGFIWIVWTTAKKSLVVTKHTISYAGSAISTYSTSRFSKNRPYKSENEKTH